MNVRRLLVVVGTAVATEVTLQFLFHQIIISLAAFVGVLAFGGILSWRPNLRAPAKPVAQAPAPMAPSEPEPIPVAAATHAPADDRADAIETEPSWEWNPQMQDEPTQDEEPILAEIRATLASLKTDMSLDPIARELATLAREVAALREDDGSQDRLNSAFRDLGARVRDTQRHLGERARDEADRTRESVREASQRMAEQVEALRAEVHATAERLAARGPSMVELSHLREREFDELETRIGRRLGEVASSFSTVTRTMTDDARKSTRAVEERLQSRIDGLRGDLAAQFESLRTTVVESKPDDAAVLDEMTARFRALDEKTTRVHARLVDDLSALTAAVGPATGEARAVLARADETLSTIDRALAGHTAQLRHELDRAATRLDAAADRLPSGLDPVTSRLDVVAAQIEALPIESASARVREDLESIRRDIETLRAEQAIRHDETQRGILAGVNADAERILRQGADAQASLHEGQAQLAARQATDAETFRAALHGATGRLDTLLAKTSRVSSELEESDAHMLRAIADATASVINEQEREAEATRRSVDSAREALQRDIDAIARKLDSHKAERSSETDGEHARILGAIEAARASLLSDRAHASVATHEALTEARESLRRDIGQFAARLDAHHTKATAQVQREAHLIRGGLDAASERVDELLAHTQRLASHLDATDARLAAAVEDARTAIVSEQGRATDAARSALTEARESLRREIDALAHKLQLSENGAAQRDGRTREALSAAGQEVAALRARLSETQEGLSAMLGGSRADILAAQAHAAAESLEAIGASREAIRGEVNDLATQLSNFTDSRAEEDRHARTEAAEAARRLAEIQRALAEGDTRMRGALDEARWDITKHVTVLTERTLSAVNSFEDRLERRDGGVADAIENTASQHAHQLEAHATRLAEALASVQRSIETAGEEREARAAARADNQRSQVTQHVDASAAHVERAVASSAERILASLAEARSGLADDSNAASARTRESLEAAAAAIRTHLDELAGRIASRDAAAHEHIESAKVRVLDAVHDARGFLASHADGGHARILAAFDEARDELRLRLGAMDTKIHARVVALDERVARESMDLHQISTEAARATSELREALTLHDDRRSARETLLLTRLDAFAAQTRARVADLVGMVGATSGESEARDADTRRAISEAIESVQRLRDAVREGATETQDIIRGANADARQRDARGADAIRDLQTRLDATLEDLAGRLDALTLQEEEHARLARADRIEGVVRQTLMRERLDAIDAAAQARHVESARQLRDAVRVGAADTHAFIQGANADLRTRLISTREDLSERFDALASQEEERARLASADRVESVLRHTLMRERLDAIDSAAQTRHVESERAWMRAANETLQLRDEVSALVAESSDALRTLIEGANTDARQAFDGIQDDLEEWREFSEEHAEESRRGIGGLAESIRVLRERVEEGDERILASLSEARELTARHAHDAREHVDAAHMRTREALANATTSTVESVAQAREALHAEVRGLDERVARLDATLDGRESFLHATLRRIEGSLDGDSTLAEEERVAARERFDQVVARLDRGVHQATAAHEESTRATTAALAAAQEARELAEAHAHASQATSARIEAGLAAITAFTHDQERKAAAREAELRSQLSALHTQQMEAVDEHLDRIASDITRATRESIDGARERQAAADAKLHARLDALAAAHASLESRWAVDVADVLRKLEPVESLLAEVRAPHDERVLAAVARTGERQANVLSQVEGLDARLQGMEQRIMTLGVDLQRASRAAEAHAQAQAVPLQHIEVRMDAIEAELLGRLAMPPPPAPAAPRKGKRKKAKLKRTDAPANEPAAPAPMPAPIAELPAAVPAPAPTAPATGAEPAESARSRAPKAAAPSEPSTNAQADASNYEMAVTRAKGAIFGRRLRG